MADTKDKVCSGCGTPLDAKDEGIEVFNTWFCSTCFIGYSAKTHRELTAEDLVLLRTIGRELAGFLPPSVLEMVAIGFYRRSTGRTDGPPPEELARFVGEIQRLAFMSYARKHMNMLKRWKEVNDEFVEDQEGEVRETIKKLTESE